MNQYAVTARKIIEVGQEGWNAYARFTPNTLLGHVWAVDVADAERQGEQNWPGWDWYTAWPDQEEAALAA